jgi:hypothetical protein
MNSMKLAVAALLALSSLAGCGGGPEGSYKFDKEAAKAELENEKDEAAKKFGQAMLEKMEMSIEIKKDGKYDAKVSMPSFKDPAKVEEQVESGEWKAEGNAITLKGKKDDLSCTLEGKKLSCSDKSGKQKLVFTKS